MKDMNSVPSGPSPQYLKLLRGQMSADEYVKEVERRVSSSRQVAQPQRRSFGFARKRSAPKSRSRAA